MPCQFFRATFRTTVRTPSRSAIGTTPGRFLAAGMLLLGSGVFSGAALAHAHLEKAQPAADSKSAEIKEIRLTFSEAVEPRLSSIRLQTSEERTVTEPGAEVDGADPKVLVVHLYEKLPPGQYKVLWSVVAADGHKMNGSYSFLSSH